MKCSVPNCERGCYGNQPYCHMHYQRVRRHGSTEARRAPNGAGSIDTKGYRAFHTKQGTKTEHIIIAERVLGRPLNPGERVHHVDEDRANNSNTNLVICQNNEYHALLHIRQRAKDACGNPNFLRCSYCDTYSDPSVLVTDGYRHLHPACRTARNRAAYERSKQC